MLDFSAAYDTSRMAILKLQRYEQFTEDEAVSIFKKTIGCNGKQAKKAWKKMKDKNKGGVIEIEPGIYRLRKENEIDLEQNKDLAEIVDVAADATQVLENMEVDTESEKDSNPEEE